MDVQASEASENLYPLMATAVVRACEDSVDNSDEPLDHHPSNVDDYAARMFGLPTRDTQGPAGSRVPDLDKRPLRPSRWDGGEEPAFRYLQDPDAPPDAAGPLARMDAEMTEADYQDEAGDAAAAAVAAVRRQGRYSSSTMLDALEVAETAYEQQQAVAAAAGQHTHLEKLGSWKGTQDAAAATQATAAAAALADVRPPDTPCKAVISEGTRKRMIQAIFEALEANPWYACEASRGVMSLAQEVEDALFASCHSKQVYQNKMNNAVRLARSVPDASDLPRIASGEPREVAEGHTVGESSPYVTGLQGIVLKPDLLP